jgi:hypothetical protein
MEEREYTFAAWLKYNASNAAFKKGFEDAAHNRVDPNNLDSDYLKGVEAEPLYRKQD